MSALPKPAEPAAAAEPEVLFHVVNRVAILTLNRPSALNALSHGMVRQLSALLAQCRDDARIAAVVLRGAGEKGFCAGGDVRALYRLARQGQAHGPDGWLQFFVDEYRLDYALHRFPKPVVALLDGIAMGGGMGLGQGRACGSSPNAAGSPCRKPASAFCPTWARRTSWARCRPRWRCTSG